MKPIKLLNLAVGSQPITSTLSLSTRPPQLPEQGPQYYLRIISPNQPWHNRHIIQLPTTKLLGLENFTVHPTTPPLKLRPLRIPDKSTYALRLSYYGDDLSRTPFIAAMLPPGGSNTTATLGKISASDPRREMMDRTPGVCPAGKECVADAFDVYAYDVLEEHQPTPGLGHLGYAGFEGHWEAVKDAPNSEGWHVYWRGLLDKGVSVPEGTKIDIEILPVEE